MTRFVTGLLSYFYSGFVHAIIEVNSIVVLWPADISCDKELILLLDFQKDAFYVILSYVKFRELYEVTRPQWFTMVILIGWCILKS